MDAWRLAQNRLTAPASVPELGEVVRQAGGIQAQVLSAAALALSARIPELVHGQVQAALWEERSLVKTYGPRGTLHLLAADDAPTHMAAMRAHPRWRDHAWTVAQGLEPAQGEALVEAVGEALAGRRLTRQELATAVAKRVGPWAEVHLLSNWGEILGPAAFAGKLCFGPSMGSKVTFVRVDQWLGSWADADPDEAMAELIRRFLAAYGPASEGEIAGWLAIRPVELRPYLEGLEPEVVSLGGRKLLALELPGGGLPPSTPTLKLLPQYDSYVLGHRQRNRLVPPAAKERIALDPKGRLESVVGVSVVLVDGVVGGLWRRVKTGRRLTITVEPTQILTPTHLDLLDQEAARIAHFLETDVSVTLNPTTETDALAVNCEL